MCTFYYRIVLRCTQHTPLSTESSQKSWKKPPKKSPSQSTNQRPSTINQSGHVLAICNACGWYIRPPAFQRDRCTFAVGCVCVGGVCMCTSGRTIGKPPLLAHLPYAIWLKYAILNYLVICEGSCQAVWASTYTAQPNIRGGGGVGGRVVCTAG